MIAPQENRPHTLPEKPIVPWMQERIDRFHDAVPFRSDVVADNFLHDMHVRVALQIRPREKDKLIKGIRGEGHLIDPLFRTKTTHSDRKVEVYDQPRRDAIAAIRWVMPLVPAELYDQDKQKYWEEVGLLAKEVLGDTPAAHPIVVSGRLEVPEVRVKHTTNGAEARPASPNRSLPLWKKQISNREPIPAASPRKSHSVVEPKTYEEKFAAWELEAEEVRSEMPKIKSNKGESLLLSEPSLRSMEAWKLSTVINLQKLLEREEYADLAMDLVRQPDSMVTAVSLLTYARAVLNDSMQEYDPIRNTIPVIEILDAIDVAIAVFENPDAKTENARQMYERVQQIDIQKREAQMRKGIANETKNK